MTLEVLICTLGRDGIARVDAMGLPHVENVSYLVSWQMPDGEIPQNLLRPDVRVITSHDTGLSRNRNHALDNAAGDVLLIADDDLRYTARQLLSVLDVFRKNPSLEVATFRYDGEDKKCYPDHECDLGKKLPKGYYVTSFELALRRNSRAGKLRFNEKMGIGARYLHAGEEELLLLAARKMGLNCRFFPVTITSHEGLTTGNRHVMPGVARAFGAYIGLAYPFTCLPRIVLKAWRLYRSGQGRFFPVMWQMLCGLVYAAAVVTPQWSPRYKTSE